MSRTARSLPVASALLVLAFLGLLVLRTSSETGAALVASSVVLCAFCWTSATHLLGVRAAAILVGLAVVIGWFSEQMGVSYGWFFGGYVYTDLLGPRVGHVPIIIPFMWFSFVYNAYVIANLIVWRAPVDGSERIGDILLMSVLTAAIVTAYDLGLDPYMVYVVKAWIMSKTDGAYFGETVQGFVGWMVVAFTITVLFRLLVRRIKPEPVTRFTRRHALLPVLAYLGSMLFLMVEGSPVETRSIVAFAMGIPILAALAGFSYWKHHGSSQVGETA